MAPLLPLVSEEVSRRLTGGRSVHLSDRPDAGALPEDAGLVAAIDGARGVSTGSALRKAEGLGRLPLSSLTVVADDAAELRPFTELVGEELNVREVVPTDVSAAGDGGFGVRQTLLVNARAAGPRLGREVQIAIRASKAGDWSVTESGVVSAGGIACSTEVRAAPVVSDAAAGDHRAVAMLPGSGFLILDTEVTPELAAEGLARDVVRAVQQARRQAGLKVSDRIALAVGGSPAVRAAVDRHRELISAETLAVELAVVELGGAELDGAVAVEVGDHQQASVSLTRSA